MEEFDLRSRQISWWRSCDDVSPYIPGSFVLQLSKRNTYVLIYKYSILLNCYKLASVATAFTCSVFLLMHLTLPLTCTDMYVCMFFIVLWTSFYPKDRHKNTTYDRALIRQMRYYADTLIAPHVTKIMETSGVYNYMPFTS